MLDIVIDSTCFMTVASFCQIEFKRMYISSSIQLNNIRHYTYIVSFIHMILGYPHFSYAEAPLDYLVLHFLGFELNPRSMFFAKLFPCYLQYFSSLQTSAFETVLCASLCSKNSSGSPSGSTNGGLSPSSEDLSSGSSILRRWMYILMAINLLFASQLIF